MNIDHTFTSGLATTIEALINQALKYDPASLQKVATLTDILAIELTSPNITLYIHGQIVESTTTPSIAVLSYCETPVTTHLKGSALGLVSLLKQPTSLANTDVSLVGSSAFLQQWQAVLQSLDIDWEEALSQILGDVAGPLSSRGIKQSAYWLKQQMNEQQRLISEYLTEELKLTPSRPELENFFEQLSSLSMDVDRVAARLQAVRQTFSQKQEGHE